jgi:hypothetical protein
MLERLDHAPGAEAVQVPAVALDDYFSEQRGPCTAMWIDVEGASGAVLRGAGRMLADTAVVIIEVEERPMWDGDHWLRPAVVEFLSGRGLSPVARDNQSRFQHNVVFVRTDLLDDDRIAQRIRQWARDIATLAVAPAA